MSDCPSCGGPIEPETDICPRCGADLCPACGALADADEAACAACGAELALICSECGGEVGSGDSACPHCGAAFDWMSDSPEDRQQAADERRWCGFGSRPAPTCAVQWPSRLW